MRLSMLCLGLVFSLLLDFSVQAAAQTQGTTTSSLENLAAWEGKVPTAKVKGKMLWQDPVFSKLLLKALGPERMKILLEWDGKKHENERSSSVTKRGSLLTFSLCKNHDCLTDNIDLFIDMRDGRVEACWAALSAPPFDHTTYWLSSDHAPRALKEAACVSYEGFAIYDHFGEQVPQNGKK